MATIHPSDLAPDAEVHYSLGSDSFDLAAGGSYETTSRDTISGAEGHPWLDVESDPEIDLGVDTVDPHVPREDDVLAAENSVAFDPELVRADRQAQVRFEPTAIDAGLDQNEEVTVGTTAQTFAADEAQPEVVVIPSVEPPVPSIPSGEEFGAPEIGVGPAPEEGTG